MNRILFRCLFRYILVLTGLLVFPFVGAGQTRTPAFALKDSEGKERALKSFYGRPVALYFFCPCADCHRVAELWGKLQRSAPSAQKTAQKNKRPALKSKQTGGKDAGPSGDAVEKRLLTLIIFAGEAEDAKRFAAETDLDVAQTVLLCDADSAMAQIYDAIPCPRVFALTSDGVLRYTNRLPGAAASVIEPVTVVTRVAEALAPVPSRKAKTRQKRKPARKITFAAGRVRE